MQVSYFYFLTRLLKATYLLYNNNFNFSLDNYHKIVIIKID